MGLPNARASAAGATVLGGSRRLAHDGFAFFPRAWFSRCRSAVTLAANSPAHAGRHHKSRAGSERGRRIPRCRRDVQALPAFPVDELAVPLLPVKVLTKVPFGPASPLNHLGAILLLPRM